MSLSLKAALYACFAHLLLLSLFFASPSLQKKKPHKKPISLHTVWVQPPKKETIKTASKPSTPSSSINTTKIEKKSQPTPKTHPSAATPAKADTHANEPTPREILEKNIKALDALLLDAPQKKFSIDLPQILTVEQEKTISPSSYEAAIVQILQKNLTLPEQGAVTVRLQFLATGILAACEILNAQSEKNSAFLQKRLQELSFPCFNDFELYDKQVQFTITFRNCEDS